MARLLLAGQPFEIACAVFDKDGTLIDFQHLWGQRTQRAVTALTERVGGDATLAAALYRALGYDPTRGQSAGDGPLAIAPTPRLYTVAATVLYQQGYGWTAAEQAVSAVFAPCMSALPVAADLLPLGDIAGLFRQFTAAGVRVVVATSDERAATQRTLELLGVAEQVSLLICGDDPTPSKPDPAALWRLGVTYGIATAQMMMVGDTVGDLSFATRAGVGCRVGVLNGAGSRDELAPLADVLLQRLDEIAMARLA